MKKQGEVDEAPEAMRKLLDGEIWEEVSAEHDVSVTWIVDVLRRRIRDLETQTAFATGTGTAANRGIRDTRRREDTSESISRIDGAAPTQWRAKTMPGFNNDVDEDDTREEESPEAEKYKRLLEDKYKELELAKLKQAATEVNPNTRGLQAAPRKPILCLDFDGVLHSYTSGWMGADVIPDPPVWGAMEFLGEAISFFDVRVFSSRSNQEGGIEAMKRWLFRHLADAERRGTLAIEVGDKSLPVNAGHVLSQIGFPTEKPPATVTLDDRAITFTGKWPSMEELQEFRPWNKPAPEGENTA